MANVCFDIDGVLIRSRNTNGHFLWTQNLERDLALPALSLKEIFASIGWGEIIVGQACFRERLSVAFAQTGVSCTVESFVSYWLQTDLIWYEESLALASRLRSAGHRLGVATNQDRIRTDFLRQTRELQGFDDFFASADLGIAKPDTSFFRKVEQRWGDELTIFIDDDAGNVAAAQAVGWQAIHFDPDRDPTASIQKLELQIAAGLEN